MKTYNINYLPDFFSVRDREQIDYAFEEMNDKKCYVFFNNGFKSNTVNTEDKKGELLWDGFLLFLNKNISLKDINNEVNLFEERLVGLQRMDNDVKANSEDIKCYIINKLKENNIDYELMEDEKKVNGNCITYDMWSTRNKDVLKDAIECIGEYNAYYVENDNFNFKISFNKSLNVIFEYNHLGELSLENDKQLIVMKLLNNDSGLNNKINKIYQLNKTNFNLNTLL